MKTRLEELTIGQFIDICAGKTEVLHGKTEIVPPAKLAMVVRSIVFEYREIADKSGAIGYISESEDLIKARLSVVMYTLCQMLVDVNAYDDTRKTLDECGIYASNLTESQLEAMIYSRLEQAKIDVAKLESEHQIESAAMAVNIRREFDELTAALMAHFKFQLDPSTMMATVYAHLVARQKAEIKAQLAAIKK